MPLSRKDLDGYMKNWDAQTRHIILKRMEDRFRRERLEHFSRDEAAILNAMLDRMIPQRPEEDIDLAGFIDGTMGNPLGRGDRQESLPPEEELFHRGLKGVQETAQEMFGKAFTALEGDQQDAVLTAIVEGSAKGGVWRTIPSNQFFTKLMMKALTGYCAHPLVWLRMGFPGPSYPEGYVWINQPEIQQRRKHFPGWKTF